MPIFTPTVTFISLSKKSVRYRRAKEVFPTPESPKILILNVKSNNILKTPVIQFLLSIFLLILYDWIIIINTS